MSSIPIVRFLNDEVCNVCCHESFRGAFEAAKPDVVLSVHPLCQTTPLRVLDRMGLRGACAAWHCRA